MSRLHPEVESFLAGPAKALAFPPSATSDTSDAASYLSKLRATQVSRAVEDREPVGRVFDTRMDQGGQARIYVPHGDGPFPILVYFHGGGWVAGDLETHDATCRRLSNLVGCTVVNVDYRLAPEHPFPAALDDALAATRWVTTHAKAIQGDPALIGVAGSSSGGNLAAAVALRARELGGPPLHVQLLIYPVLDSRMATPSYRQFDHGFLLDATQMAWFWDQYVPEPGDRDNPAASPAHAPELKGLPPAIVVVAECDPLRDEGEAYASRLTEAGVDTRLLRYDGQIHGFAGMLGVLSDADRALADIAAELQTLLGARS